MDWGTILTTIATGIAVIGFVYQIMRNFKEDVNKSFEKHEKRFEILDQRLFLLCIGKSLPDILKAERETFYKEDGGK
jgi:hypothetical protein